MPAVSRNASIVLLSASSRVPLSTRNGGVLPIELTLDILPIHLSCRHSGAHGVFRGAKPACTLSLPIRPIVRVNDAVLKRYSPYILLRGYSESLL